MTIKVDRVRKRSDLQRSVNPFHFPQNRAQSARRLLSLRDRSGFAYLWIIIYATCTSTAGLRESITVFFLITTHQLKSGYALKLCLVESCSIKWTATRGDESLLNSRALKLIVPNFTEIVTFEEEILVDAQPPTELYKILHIVAGEEAATCGIFPATATYHWYRLQQ